MWLVVFQDKGSKREIEENWTMEELYQCVFLIDSNYIDQRVQSESNGNG